MLLPIKPAKVNEFLGGGPICGSVPPWAPRSSRVVGNKAGAHGGTPLQIGPLPNFCGRRRCRL